MAIEKENVTMVECDSKDCNVLVPDPGTRWESCNPNMFGTSTREVRNRAECEECKTRSGLFTLELQVKELERQAKALAARRKKEDEETPF